MRDVELLKHRDVVLDLTKHRIQFTAIVACPHCERATTCEDAEFDTEYQFDFKCEGCKRGIVHRRCDGLPGDRQGAGEESVESREPEGRSGARGEHAGEARKGEEVTKKTTKKKTKVPAKKAKAKKPAAKKAPTPIEKLKVQNKRLREMLKEAEKETWHEQNSHAETKAAAKEQAVKLAEVTLERDAARAIHANHVAEVHKLQSEITHYRDSLEETVAFLRDVKNQELDDDDKVTGFDPDGGAIFDPNRAPRPLDAKPWHLALADEMVQAMRDGPTMKLSVPFEELEAERLKRLPELCEKTLTSDDCDPDTDDDDSDEDEDDDDEEFGEDPAHVVPSEEGAL